MLLPGCDLDGAEIVLERVRATLAQRLESGTVPVFTMSAGLALVDRKQDLADALRSADGALYRAKDAGRDRVARAAGIAAVPDADADTDADTNAAAAGVRVPSRGRA